MNKKKRTKVDILQLPLEISSSNLYFPAKAVKSMLMQGKRMGSGEERGEEIEGSACLSQQPFVNFYCKAQKTLISSFKKSNGPVAV